MLCRAFYTCLGNLSALTCSAAPITNCLVVLINHELWVLHSPYFTPPTLLPCGRVSAFYCPPYALPICFSAHQLFQCKGVIQAWNMSTATFQEQFFQRSANNDESLVCYLFQKQRLCYLFSLHFSLLIFRSVS